MAQLERDCSMHEEGPNELWSTHPLSRVLLLAPSSKLVVAHAREGWGEYSLTHSPPPCAGHGLFPAC